MEKYDDILRKLWVLSLAVAAALCCNIVYGNVTIRSLQDIVSWHAENMAGTQVAPVQFRVICFLGPELLHRMGFDLIQSYMFLRFLYLAGSFAVFHAIVRRLVDQPFAAEFMVAALALYYAASTMGHFQLAEEPNLLVFALFFWLTLRDRGLAALMPVFLFGVFNKETVVFLLPFLFFYRLFGQKRVFAAFRDTAVLSVIFIAVSVGIRMHYGIDRPYLGGLWQYEFNYRKLLENPYRNLMWMLPSVVPLVWLGLRWKQVSPIVRSLCPVVILFVVGHMLISRTEEFRTYTPLALLMWPGVLAALARMDPKLRN